MTQSLSDAASAFEKTLRELGFSVDEAELGNATELGERAALLIAAGAMWRHRPGVPSHASDATAISLLLQAPLAECPRIPGLEWTESLDEPERASFRADVVSALRSALAGDGWELFDNELASWRATAEVNADPELARALLEEGDPADEVILRRPE
jgi:hypothetical protein